MSLLEINVISAQDLPPVAKMLRTFAVVYMSPEHKLTTRVDHQGHTNPTWNYKIAFHVHEKFLKQESSAITFKIYNVAWLRDLPIGTTRLFINNLSPPLNKNPNFRRVSLQIARPSGHLQGTLNLGVQLVQNTVPGCELKAGPMIKNVRAPYEDNKIHDKIRAEMTTSSLKNIWRIKSRIFQSFQDPKIMSENDNMNKTGLEPRKRSADWNEYGSSVFENWTEPNNREEDQRLRSKTVKWRAEDQIPLKHDKKSGHRRKTHSDKGQSRQKGLMSCFGNAYGFQFSFICGSKTMKKKKNFHMVNVPHENAHTRVVCMNS